MYIRTYFIITNNECLKIIILPTEFHLVFKRHQTEATSISVDMNTVKTSVPDVVSCIEETHKGMGILLMHRN